MQFTRSQPGCKLIEVSKSTDDPRVFFVYEKWDKKEDWAAYVGKRTENGSLAAMGEMFAAPPEFLHYESTSV
jgi:quinol monooxygenase YgiN